MARDPNPYDSPSGETGHADRNRVARHFGWSLVCMTVGAAFCVGSSYVLIQLRYAYSQEAVYRAYGLFPFAYMLFYATAGFFMCVFHGAYLAFGRPNQAVAGVEALGVALLLTAVVVAVLKFNS